MGVENFYRNLSLLLVFFLFPAIISAQSQKESTAPGYSYTLKEDGTPVFEQTISWRQIPQAFAYELVLEDSDGNEIFRKKTDKTSVIVQLSPGNYRYSLIIYNLLDKPEISSDWQSIEVRKAEIPKILNVSPGVIYIEEGNFQLILNGENLLAGGEYRLVDQKNSNAELKIDNVSQNEKGEIVLQLPELKLGSGDYSVRIINPGGLTDVSEAGFRIRYQKPVEISLTLGYAAAIVLMDDWVRETWSKNMYWRGFLARADLFLIKKPWGYVGPGIDSHFHMLDGGTSEAAINTQILKTGLNIVYKLSLTRSFQIEARAGGGIAYSTYKFDYEGISGSETSSLDLYFSAGGSFFWSLNRRLFLGTVVEFMYTFQNSYNQGILQPAVLFGYKY